MRKITVDEVYQIVTIPLSEAENSDDLEIPSDLLVKMDLDDVGFVMSQIEKMHSLATFALESSEKYELLNEKYYELSKNTFEYLQKTVQAAIIKHFGIKVVIDASVPTDKIIAVTNEQIVAAIKQLNN